jgi:hypothetical protein
MFMLLLFIYYSNKLRAESAGCIGFGFVFKSNSSPTTSPSSPLPRTHKHPGEIVREGRVVHIPGPTLPEGWGCIAQGGGGVLATTTHLFFFDSVSKRKEKFTRGKLQITKINNLKGWWW